MKWKCVCSFKHPRYEVVLIRAVYFYSVMPTYAESQSAFIQLYVIILHTFGQMSVRPAVSSLTFT